MRNPSSRFLLRSAFSRQTSFSASTPPCRLLQRCLYSSISDSSSSLPRIAQPSLWTSMVPKFFRESRSSLAKPKEKKGWNPYTFHIIVFLLIGSNAINQIALRREFTNFSRKADAKILLLEDVLRRVHEGEDVDVERLLGTGDPEQEKEWEEVLKEIEEADLVPSKPQKGRGHYRELKRKDQAAVAAAVEKAKVEALENGNADMKSTEAPETAGTETGQMAKKGPGRFY